MKKNHSAAKITKLYNKLSSTLNKLKKGEISKQVWLSESLNIIRELEKALPEFGKTLEDKTLYNTFGESLKHAKASVLKSLEQYN